MDVRFPLGPAPQQRFQIPLKFVRGTSGHVQLENRLCNIIDFHTVPYIFSSYQWLLLRTYLYVNQEAVLPYLIICCVPVPVDALSKSWVCDLSPADIVGSNPTGGMDIRLLRVFCVVR